MTQPKVGERRSQAAGPLGPLAAVRIEDVAARDLELRCGDRPPYLYCHAVRPLERACPTCAAVCALRRLPALPILLWVQISA